MNDAGLIHQAGSVPAQADRPPSGGRRRLGAALAALAAAGTGRARAETAVRTSLVAAADATIFAEQTGGTAYDAVADGRGPNLWTSVIAAGVVRRALLRFELAPLPLGAQVVSASLDLFAVRIRSPQSLTLHRLLEDWSEGPANGGEAGVGAAAQPGDCTWSHARWPDRPWATRGGTFAAAASGSAAVGGWPAPIRFASTASMVADVQGWIEDPASNHGWLVQGAEDGELNATRLGSREADSAAARPALVVDWLPPLADEQVPLPPWALALFGLGAAAAIVRRRRA